MTFQQLQYLLEVNRTNSISQAARNLYVTSSSVSISINALEKELGYPIFIRTQGGLSLTPKGKSVIEYTKRLYDTYQQLNNIGQETYNHVRISAASYDPICDAYVKLVAENIHRTDIAFSLYNYSINDIIKMLTYAELDCGVVFHFSPRISVLEKKLKEKKLHWKNLCDVPVYFLFGPGHKLYNKETIAVKDLENEILIDTGARNMERSDFLRGYMSIYPKNIRVASRAVIKYKLLELGYGYTIGIKPDDETIAKYRIRCVPMEGVYHRLLFITNPENEVPPEIQRFLELLEEVLEKKK